MELYKQIASLLQAIANCEVSGNKEWRLRHSENLNHLVSEHMPSGSGFDSGTNLDREKSHVNKLVFTTSFHHMNEVGSYDGWTDHTVTVTPSLSHDFTLRVSGKDRNDTKEYIYSAFSEALQQEVE